MDAGLCVLFAMIFFLRSADDTADQLREPVPVPNRGQRREFVEKPPPNAHDFYQVGCSIGWLVD